MREWRNLENLEEATILAVSHDSGSDYVTKRLPPPDRLYALLYSTVAFIMLSLGEGGAKVGHFHIFTHRSFKAAVGRTEKRVDLA